MSRLEKLIAQYCPNGVEYKTLGEIGRICMCKRVMKNETNSIGGIPFYKIGTFGKITDAYIPFELFEKYKKAYPYPKKGDILLSASGTIGKTVIFNGEDAYFQDSNIIWIDNNEKLIKNKFLYYCYQITAWKTEGGTIKRLYNENLSQISVPVPPLPVQEEIVRILDAFMELEFTLEVELEARRKQYEYYRNELLSFDKLGGGGRTGGVQFLQNLCDKYCPNGVVYRTLGDICNFNRGQSLTKQSANVGNIPVISGGMKPAFYTNIANRDACSITVAGSGANAGYIWWHQDPIFCADSFTVDIKSEYKMSFNLKYIYYYLKCKERSIIDSKPQGGVPHVHGKDIKNFSVPVPPLPVQEEIVRILDRFDALVNDISIGLPAELSARRKQYEYYRNRLLTFERAR